MEWSQIFDEYADSLVLYARQWTTNHADAEEAVQDGFVRFWKARLHDGKPRCEVVALLYTTVKRAAQDLRRSSSRRLNRETKAYEESDLNRMFETEKTDNFKLKLLESALNDIEPEQREVVVMKIWGNLTFKVIADSLDVSENTVASRYRYALEKLKKKIGGSYEQQIC